MKMLKWILVLVAIGSLTGCITSGGMSQYRGIASGVELLTTETKAGTKKLQLNVSGGASAKVTPMEDGSVQIDATSGSSMEEFLKLYETFGR